MIRKKQYRIKSDGNLSTFRKVEKKLSYGEIEKPTFNTNKCIDLRKKQTRNKLITLLGYYGFLPRFGRWLYNPDGLYWRINFSNEKNSPLQDNLKSLHRVIKVMLNNVSKKVVIKQLKNYSDYYHCHHVCGNPHCINPEHTIFVRQKNHKKIDKLTRLIRQGKLTNRKKQYHSELLGKNLTNRVLEKTLNTL